MGYNSSPAAQLYYSIRALGKSREVALAICELVMGEDDARYMWLKSYDDKTIMDYMAKEERR